MRIVIFLVCSLTVCGFYLCVLAQLYREGKGLKAREKSLQKRLCEREPETPSARAMRIVKTANERIALTKRGTRSMFKGPDLNPTANIVAGSRAEALARRDAVISLILGVGGLAALFAGIELFNSLVTWAH